MAMKEWKIKGKYYPDLHCKATVPENINNHYQEKDIKTKNKQLLWERKAFCNSHRKKSEEYWKSKEVILSLRLQGILLVITRVSTPIRNNNSNSKILRQQLQQLQVFTIQSHATSYIDVIVMSQKISGINKWVTFLSQPKPTLLTMLQNFGDEDW